MADLSTPSGYLETAVDSLTQALEHAPGQRALALGILPEHERRLVLEQFNATQAPYPRDLLVHELFEQQVRRTPEAIALVFEDRDP